MPYCFALKACRLLNRSYAYIRFAFAFLAEDHRTVYQSEQSMILAHTYILARIMHGSALTYNDVAGFGKLTAEQLYAQSFAF